MGVVEIVEIKVSDEHRRPFRDVRMPVQDVGDQSNFSAIALIMGRCLATNKRFLLLRTAAILKMFAILALKELVDDSI